MSKTVYISKEGIKIDMKIWKDLRSKPEYVTIAEYDNGQVYVAAKWKGDVPPSLASTFKDYWPIYELVVGNYTTKGSIAADPVENGKTFSTQEGVVKAYEDFLERWTESHRDEEGNFVEEDNQFTPPPPPDPDAPTTSASCVSLGEDDVGAW